MPNPQLARPQHQPRGGIHDFTHKILPVVFFLHFIVTGTVFLVYVLYLHEPIPEKYAIGASITFGFVVIPMCLGYITMHKRKRHGGNRRSDEEMTYSPPQSRSRSRARGGIKEYWSRWKNFCQVYGNQQREYVREFVGKRRETVVDGTNRIKSLNDAQIFTFVLEKWTHKLAQSRLKRLEKDSKAPEASCFTDKANDNNQKQPRSFQALRDAQTNVQKRRDRGDRSVSENSRIIPDESHARNLEVALHPGYSFESNCESDPNFAGSGLRESIESYRNPSLKHENNTNERRSLVAPDDVLPRHPEPNELYVGSRQRQISQIHSATTRGRSLSRIQGNGGHTAHSQRGRGGSLPALCHQQQADDWQSSFKLQNTCSWTADNPFSKEHKDFIHSPRIFRNLREHPRQSQMKTVPAMAHLSPDEHDTKVLELPPNTEQTLQATATTRTRPRNNNSSIRSPRFSNGKDSQGFRKDKAYSANATSPKIYSESA